MSGTSAAHLSWVVTQRSASAGIGVNPNGDFDFSAAAQPVWVTLTLTDTEDPDAVFFPGGAIGFADRFDDGDGVVQRVGSNHHQISDIQLTDSRTLSFCYRNVRVRGPAGDPDHYKVSRYVIYLSDGTSAAAPLSNSVDPQIGNH